MEEQKTNFINSTPSSTGSINPFEEIRKDLGEIDFWTKKDAPKKEPVDLAKVFLRVSDIVLKVLFVISVITTIDVYVRSEPTNDGVAKYFPCSYLSLLINDYDNTSTCKTITGILTDKRAEFSTLEKDTISALSIFIPRKISLSEMLDSPEMDFIQHVQQDRISFKSLFDSLSSIYTYVPSNEHQLECSNFDGKEDGNFSIKCKIYGSAIPCTTTECKSSRQVALDFFDEISKNNSFRYLNYPRSLDIEKFSSSELGAKSTFGTATNLSLSLKYIPSPFNPTPNK